MKTKDFTEEEVVALKELAQDHIRFIKIHRTDENGKPYPYRNRFETYDDAYNNLKNVGFTHKQIIERIGVKDGKERNKKHN